MFTRNKKIYYAYIYLCILDLINAVQNSYVGHNLTFKPSNVKTDVNNHGSDRHVR